MFFRSIGFCLLMLLSVPPLLAAPAKRNTFVQFKNRADALFRQFRDGQWGHHSLTIATEDRFLYEYESRKPIKPASTLKLLTSIAALDTLGSDFKFETLLRIQEQGDFLRIFLKGQGDPSWSSRFLTPQGYRDHTQLFFKQLQDQLDKIDPTRSKRIEIVLDDFDFAGPSTGPWKEENLARCYSAGIGAFNFDFNCDDVAMIPPKKLEEAPVFLEKWAPGYFEFLDRTRWQAKDRFLSELPGYRRNLDEVLDEMDEYGDRGGVGAVWHENVSYWRADGSREVIFEGDGLPVGAPSELFRVTVANSTEYFGKLLQERLREAGFVSVRWVRGAFPTQERGASQPVSFASMPQLIYMLNKVSMNLVGESLFRAISLRQDGRSTYDGSRHWVSRMMAERFEFSKNEFQSADGSGLSHDNRVSTRLLAQAVRYALQQNWSPILYSSLPVAGSDGTLASRMRAGCYLENRYYKDPKACGLKNNVRAKTGTIDGVITLAGTLKNYQGKRVVFAVSSQDFANTWDIRNRLRSVLHEQLLAELYRTQF